MSLRDRVRAAGAWIVGPRGVMALGVSLLFFLMAVSFLNIPWNLPAAECGGEPCEIPVYPDPGTPPEGTIGGSLFGPYATLVFLSALVLAACMIGGVYLAKTEEGE